MSRTDRDRPLRSGRPSYVLGQFVHIAGRSWMRRPFSPATLAQLSHAITATAIKQKNATEPGRDQRGFAATPAAGLFHNPQYPASRHARGHR
jgi:hypothetical protein